MEQREVTPQQWHWLLADAIHRAFIAHKDAEPPSKAVIAEIVAEHDPVNAVNAYKCVWFEDCDGNWDTACGETYTIIADSPAENGLRFCCFCGDRLIEKEYEEPDGR